MLYAILILVIINGILLINQPLEVKIAMIVENLVEQVRTYLSSLPVKEDVLVTERDIAKRFNTNHSNSRRALITLESEGRLRCVPRRGYQLVDYSRTEVQSMFRVRVAIEAEAARQAAKRADREDILRMMLILEEAETVLHNTEHQARLDEDFHRALVGASKDNLLIRLFEFMVVLCSPQSPERRTNEYRISVVEDHRRILNAVKRKDYLAADKAVVRHLGPILKEREAFDLKLKKEALDDKGVLAAWQHCGGADNDPAAGPAEESDQAKPDLDER